jgi:hypothetical protein
MQKSIMTPSKNTGEEQIHWTKYQSAALEHRESCCTRPEYFSLPPEERFYQQCLACPLDESTRSQMPLLLLPIRIHLLRCKELGRSSDLNKESIQHIVGEMNRYWEQAGIQFELLVTGGVLDHDMDQILSNDVRKDSKHFIMKVGTCVGARPSLGQGREAMPFVQ